ncbi:hypothetical protein Anas_04562, partial [Armadillidium nasatum]
VGLMRNGRLLEEASPQVLLDYYKFSSLESLFLKLCLEDGNTENKQSQNENDESSPDDTSQKALEINSVQNIRSLKPLCSEEKFEKFYV